MKEIYLDNSATTPISEGALASYLRVSRESWGNPSSLHGLGLRASHEVERARGALTRAMDARGGTLVFTGSGSEANNLAIFGRAYAKDRYRRGSRIITTAGEHASVAMPLARLQQEGYEIVEIATHGGALHLEELEKALTPSTILVTMMAVNNETGAHYDLPAAARLTHRLAPNAIFHADATQAFLKLPLSARRDGYDLLTVSGHKIEGPKGIGALWISSDITKSKGLAAQMLGGGQEEGLRSGTVNVPACAAFGTACEEGLAALPMRQARLDALSSYLIARLTGDPTLSELRLNLPARRAPHILNMTLPSIKSETMLHFLSGEGIYVSSGSACSSHGRHTSAPLAAFGMTEREADCSIRISLSHKNTEEELDRFAEVLARGIATLSRIR